MLYIINFVHASPPQPSTAVHAYDVRDVLHRKCLTSHSCQASLSSNVMYYCLFMASMVVAANCCGFVLENGWKS